MRKLMRIIIFILIIIPMTSYSDKSYASLSCRLLFARGKQNKQIFIGPSHIAIDAKKSPKFNKYQDGFYLAAQKFSQTVGIRYLDLVLSKLSPRGKTTIVVAMGGAEHLGTMLEIYLSMFPDLNRRVKIKYVPLQTEIIRPWYAIKSVGQQYVWISRSGIGQIPEGFRLNGGRVGKPSSFIKYLKRQDIFGSDKIIILDTGHRGTTVEAVAYVARTLEYKGDVEGVLVSHNNINTENSVPIYSLNTTYGMDQKITSYWAIVLDHNNIEGAQMPSDLNAFQRSYDTQVSFVNGKILVRKIPLNSKEQQTNYLATLLGYYDALLFY